VKEITMSFSFVIGENVSVDSEEFYEKLALGAFSQLEERAEADPKATLEFSSGTISASELLPSPASWLGTLEGLEDESDGGVIAFSPIGLGKPLSVEVLAIYTGKLPTYWGIGKPNLLLLSAVKSIESLETAPKAINCLQQGAGKCQYLVPSTESEGSPIVYYTPGLTSSTLTIDITLVADTFDDNIINMVSGALKAAKGLPVFALGTPAGAAASAVLMAGPTVLEVIGSIGSTFLDGKPFLKQTFPFRFETPDFSRVVPQTFYAYNESNRRELEPYLPRTLNPGCPDQRIALVHKDTGQEYDGDAPYIIMSLDGRNRDEELANFAPKLAGAALMQKFFGSSDPGGEALLTLEKAMGLYNDLTFRSKYDSIQNELNKLDKKRPDYPETSKRLEDRLDAYKKNIRNREFLPEEDE
jgi:hypothetical protein